MKAFSRTKDSAALRARILEIVMRPGLRPTYRDIMKETGITSPSGVHLHLLALREMGLVTWEEKQARTLRATCRWIPERML